jgi:site-specific DNA-methyltransferase (adenine-specific)
MNYLYYGDNLYVLRDKIADESVDLIYLDPPFNSSRNYNLLFKQVKGELSPAQIMAFEDTWTWSPLLYEEFKSEPRNAKLFPLIAALYEILGQSEMMAYVLMMAPRLLELHRKLKPTGSLYLHCDPVASHYLKVMLDAVFGPDRFRNEVTWKRTSSHSDARRKFPDVTDILLYYAKSDRHFFQPQYKPYSEKHVREKFATTDHTGRQYTTSDLRSPGPRPNLTYDYTASNGITYKPHPNGWAVSIDRMREYDRLGLLYFPKSPDGRLRLKRYLDEAPGELVDTVWDDIAPINSQARERRGYPTQKPLALLERVIAASSNEGDVVMDPFCGCGTAIVAAERMNRKWIGIDITYLAINEVIYRLNTERIEGKPLEYELVGTPVDALGAQKLFESTAHQNHKPFEQFCVSLVAGEYREKMGADRGIDGVIHLWDHAGKLRKIVIQVKGGALTLSAVRDFASVIKDNDAVMGLLISMKEPTAEMKLVAEQQGYADWQTQKKYPKMQMRTVKQLLEPPKQPFEIPESYRVQKSEGVGKRQPGQMGMELEG